MKTNSKSLIFLCVILFSLLAGCDRISLKNLSDSYYVSPSGDDNNSGTINKPWKTIEKVNSIDLNPGDTVFFQGNQVFTGMLKLDSLDAGDENMNVVITSYGGGKAVIDGDSGLALLAEWCDFLEICELEFRGKGRKEGNMTDGVLIKNSNAIQIDQVEVYGFQHSG